MIDELKFDPLEFEPLEYDPGPFWPVTLRTHSEADTRHMLGKPGHTLEHGALTVHAFNDGKRIRVVITDASGNGVSIEPEFSTDAVNLPGGHVLRA
jgi:hypothetical protein